MHKFLYSICVIQLFVRSLYINQSSEPTQAIYLIENISESIDVYQVQANLTLQIDVDQFTANYYLIELNGN